MQFLEILLLFFAVILDFLIAEPPLFLHPVVWFGKIAKAFEKAFAALEKYGSLIQFFLGTVATLFAVLLALMLAILPLPQPLQFLWEAYLLLSSISIKSMLQHVSKCTESNFNPKEVQKIVSRDTSKLNYSQLRSAVIESTAENYVDGVFAPLFYFSIFGVAGAIVYRAINTMDSMIGYRGRYEYFGKFSARLDDVANYIPARISLLFFEIFKLGSVAYGLKNKVKLNGCTIAAMSYVLGVKLEKPGFYTLPGREAEDSDVVAALRIFKILSLMAVVFSLLLLIIRTFIMNLLS
ncbi:MAG: adenosylcobinamide-phosphate synthase CbiB [Archaeoglobaceae archaeon]